MFIIYTIDVGTPLDLPAVTIPIIISLNEGESKKIILWRDFKESRRKEIYKFYIPARFMDASLKNLRIHPVCERAPVSIWFINMISDREAFWFICHFDEEFI